VNRLEVYSTTSNNRNLVTVNYFEGKIIVTKNGSHYLCTSPKNGKEYFKFENWSNGYLKITSSDFISNSGMIKNDIFNTDNVKLILKGPEFELVYYLSSINEDEIYSSITSGTGIFLNSNTILTNYHVVKEFDKLTIDFQDKTYSGKVYKFDKSLDIALVKVDQNIVFTNAHLIFANYVVGVGSQVFVCGYPLLNRLGNELKITSGIISSLRGFKDDDKYLQTTAPVDPGNSGGPLIDEFGNIIGLISAKYTPGTNVGYALKLKYLIDENFLKSTTTNKIRLTTQQIYKKAKNTVCIIKCFSY
jgi:S1-C subfamily serine protease